MLPRSTVRRYLPPKAPCSELLYFPPFCIFYFPFILRLSALIFLFSLFKIIPSPPPPGRWLVAWTYVIKLVKAQHAASMVEPKLAERSEECGTQRDQYQTPIPGSTTQPGPGLASNTAVTTCKEQYESRRQTLYGSGYVTLLAKPPICLLYF
jgi:hypothetical protein